GHARTFAGSTRVPRGVSPISSTVVPAGRLTDVRQPRISANKQPSHVISCGPSLGSNMPAPTTCLFSLVRKKARSMGLPLFAQTATAFSKVGVRFPVVFMQALVDRHATEDHRCD